VCEHRHFKFGVQVHHSKSQPTDEKLSLNKNKQFVIQVKFIDN